MEKDGMVATGELAYALDHGLASVVDSASPIGLGITFRAQDGRICRSCADSHALTGLACRRGNRWDVEVLAGNGDTARGDLRQAASGWAPEVQAAIDARLQGEPFDAAQERDAQAHGWR
jgi:hypothetical protein